MKNSIFIIDEESNYDVSSFKIEAYMLCLMKKINLKGCELSILFCDNNRIQELNKNYRDKDKATDVLSFPQNENNLENYNGTVLGDIVIATEVAYGQGEEFGTGFEEELKRLLIHGLLHLIGYDHVKGEEEANKMREYEGFLLGSCGGIK